MGRTAGFPTNKTKFKGKISSSSRKFVGIIIKVFVKKGIIASISMLIIKVANKVIRDLIKASIRELISKQVLARRINKIERFALIFKKETAADKIAGLVMI